MSNTSSPFAAPTIPHALAWRATHTPDRLSVVADGVHLDCAGLYDRARCMAARLAAAGVRRGERVALLLPNGLAMVVAVHALAALGVVLVPLNLRLTATELAWPLADSGAAWLLHDPRTARMAAAALDACDTSGVTLLDAAAFLGSSTDRERLAHGPDSAASPDAPFAILYTSGTTGRPKGAVLTQANFWWSAIGSAMQLGLRDEDRWLACLPLFHVGGLSILFRATWYGIAALVHERFDAVAVRRAIDDDGVTLVSLVPTTLQRLLDAQGDTRFPATLRCVLLGGAPAALPLLERCAALGVPVAQTYGLTECASQVATLPPAQAPGRLGSAGRPLFPTEIRIADQHGAPLPATEPGEILVRGPTVMSGYHANAGATAQALRDGWFHTGDVGRCDDDGYLYVLDRRDDLIVSGGENVYPAEVEGVLLAHPGVLEAAVIGEADERWGQCVVAVVRLAAGAAIDVPALTAHCRATLAGYKVPRRFVEVTAPLPRTASGKLRRVELRGTR